MVPFFFLLSLGLDLAIDAAAAGEEEGGATLQLVKLAVIWTQARPRDADPSQLDGCTAAEEGFKDTKSALCSLQLKNPPTVERKNCRFYPRGLSGHFRVSQSAERDLVAFLVAAALLGGAKSCSSKLAVIDAVAGRRRE